jgi:hypothetical protein
MPFRDATSGKESYGAGRYMDNHRPGLHLLPDGRLEVDLNYAYNPYCAYNESPSRRPRIGCLFRSGLGRRSRDSRCPATAVSCQRSSRSKGLLTVLRYA